MDLQKKYIDMNDKSYNNENSWKQKKKHRKEKNQVSWQKKENGQKERGKPVSWAA